MLEPDPVAFRRAMEDAGFLRPGAPVSDEAVTEYFGHFYSHMRERGRHPITPEFASEIVRRFFDVKGPYGEVMQHANVPPAFVGGAAGEPRPLRGARAARRRGRLALDRRGAVAVGQRTAGRRARRARGRVAGAGGRPSAGRTP